MTQLFNEGPKTLQRRLAQLSDQWILKWGKTEYHLWLLPPHPHKKNDQGGIEKEEEQDPWRAESIYIVAYKYIVEFNSNSENTLIIMTLATLNMCVFFIF